MIESIYNPKNKVLIVDDNPQFASILKKILSVTGFQEITLLESPHEAYVTISESPDKFDLIFVDFHFPGGETGGDLLTRLKDAGLLKDKVSFLVTSEPTIDNQKQAQKAGARGVVAKPFDRLAIKSQLDKVERELKIGDGW